MFWREGAAAMKKVKGVVMRVSGSKTVVYTREGDFLEIPTPKDRPPVGRTIEVTLPSQRPWLKHFLLKYAAAAAVLILAVVMGVVNPLLGPGAAVASVALDINYGVELLVNKEGKVIKARDVSRESDYMVDGPGLKGQDIYQAVELILDDAGKKGVLGKDENLVLVSVVPLNKRGVNVVDEARLRSVVREEMISKNIYGVVMVSQADKETKQRAENLGISVNSYMVYERCQQDGLNVQADTFRGGDIQKALAGANTSVTGLFPEKSFEVRKQDNYWWQGEDGNRVSDPGKPGSWNMENEGYHHENSNRWGMTGGNTSNWGEHDYRPTDGGPAPSQPPGGSPVPSQPPGAAAPKPDGQKAQENPEHPGQQGMPENWRPMREQQSWPSGSSWQPRNMDQKRTNNYGEHWD